MIGIRALIDAVTSHAAGLGVFDVVQGHEPKSMPAGSGAGTGLTYAVIVSNIGPARTGSGLAATTIRVELTGRIYKPFKSQPEDAIDLDLVDALDRVFEAYSGDFELGGHARNVDVLGGQGQALSARAGYVNIDGTTYRTLDVIIPIIVNDAFNQEA